MPPSPSGEVYSITGVVFALVRTFAGFRGGVEEGIQLEVFLLRDRVELVVVALGALQGEAEHGGGDGIDLVHGVVDAVFLGDGAALVGVHAVAQEAGGGDLVGRGVRE